mgnify:FL=1
MYDILYELFTNGYDITPKLNKRQQEIARQTVDEWEKIKAVFGREFVDHMAELEGELEDWQNLHYYRSGFSLGVRLMLEIFGFTSGE